MNPDAPVRFVPPLGAERWNPVAEWTNDDWTCWLEQHHWTQDQISQYLDIDRYRYGFGVTKDKRLAGDSDIGDATIQWLYNPGPRAITLHACNLANFLWGGAAGGMKSYSARWESLKMLFSREHFRAILMRRELNELQRTHLDKLENELVRINRAFGKQRAKLLKSPPPQVIVDDMDSKMFAGHAANEGDEEKYLSEDYDLAIFDEATRLRKKQIVGVGGRVRNDTKLNRKGRTILTTNPGGPAHDFCLEYFIDKTVDLTMNPKYDPNDYGFILSRLSDNPYYMDADGSYDTYEKRLFMYEPDRRKQLLNGDWSAVVGQFFAEFDASRHVVEMEVA